MRRIKPLSYAAIALLVFACTQADESALSSAAETGTDSVNPQELNQEAVANLATDFLNELEKNEADKKPSTRSVSNGFTVKVGAKSYFSRSGTTPTHIADDDEFQLPVYEVSVSSGQQKGIVYVSADERNAEVIAFIPKANSTPEAFEESGAAFFVEWAKAAAYDRMKRTVATRAISGRSDGGGYGVTPIDKPGTRILQMGGPLVFVEWGQTWPFNYQLPLQTNSTTAHVYAGYATTAACQLMTAIQPNLTIDGVKMDWNYLTKEPTIYPGIDPQDKMDMVCLLYKWAFQELKAKPLYENGKHTGTSVDLEDSKAFYNNYFTTGTYTAYNVDDVRTSIFNMCPVFIHGEGHAWIIDGLIIAQKATATRALVDKYDVFLHANFGWNGQNDGYFKLDMNSHVIFKGINSDSKYDSRKLNIYLGLEDNLKVYNVTTE